MGAFALIYLLASLSMKLHPSVEMKLILFTVLAVTAAQLTEASVEQNTARTAGEGLLEGMLLEDLNVQAGEAKPKHEIPFPKSPTIRKPIRPNAHRSLRCPRADYWVIQFPARVLRGETGAKKCYRAARIGTDGKSKCETSALIKTTCCNACTLKQSENAVDLHETPDLGAEYDESKCAAFEEECAAFGQCMGSLKGSKTCREAKKGLKTELGNEAYLERKLSCKLLAALCPDLPRETERPSSAPVAEEVEKPTHAPDPHGHLKKVVAKAVEAVGEAVEAVKKKKKAKGAQF